MKTVHLDCATGISGDMTLAALIDAGVDADAIRAGIDSLGLDGVRLHVESIVKGGFAATYVRVEHPEQHAHRHLGDIREILARSTGLSGSQRELAERIFLAVANAEATVHGSTVDAVHFHEVGAIDSIVDIVGAAIGFDLLGADRVTCTPVPTGFGRIHIDHGVCAVPAPGTAELLKGIPLDDVPVEAELTTPTGAAIVTTLVDEFTRLPGMTIESIGYGAGTMDFPDRANLLRLFVGTEQVDPHNDQVVLLETNLDDVSGEIVGHTRDRLFEAGALDVTTTPIQMKKGRPGVTLSVIANPTDAGRLEEIVFDETGTFGIRRHVLQRAKRTRAERTVETPFGPVRGKEGRRRGGRPLFTPEFDDCARIAGEKGVTLRQVYRAAITAGEATEPSRPTTDGHSHSHDHTHDHGSHDH